MKVFWLKGSIAAGLAITICSGSASAAVDAPYEVGTWANFCKGAFSHTFDDYPNQTGAVLTDGQKAFDDKNFNMTMFVQVGSVKDWKPLQDAFAKGHEIASHNINHDVNTQTFDDARDAIKKNVPGEKCVSLAYPNCTCNSDAATLQVYVAARNCGGAFNEATPTKFAQINSFMMGTSAGQCNCVKDAASWNKTADDAIRDNKWAVSCNHGVGSGHGWANTSVSELKTHLDYLDKNRDKIWVETFGNIACYIKERGAASVTKKDSTENSITISITDNLPDSIYNYPLSIRRPLPSGWTTAVVTQKGKAVDDTIVTVSGKQYVMFQAIPDGGDVVISKSGTAVIRQAFRKTDGTAPVSRRESTLIFDSHRFGGEGTTVTLFSLTGKILARYTLHAGATSVVLPAKGLTSTAFIAKISGNGNSWSGMFMPQM